LVAVAETPVTVVTQLLVHLLLLQVVVMVVREVLELAMVVMVAVAVETAMAQQVLITVNHHLVVERKALELMHLLTVRMLE
jgi:hypothetical protein